MKAVIKQVKGCSFVGESDSGHPVNIDTPKDSFGFDTAAHPMELVLIALGSCSGCDVVSILNKKKVRYKKFEIHLEAERAESYPKVFKKIHVEYMLYGKDINPVHVGRAIELSMEKYCPVFAMLKKSVEITSSYKIIK